MEVIKLHMLTNVIACDQKIAIKLYGKKYERRDIQKYNLGFYTVIDIITLKNGTIEIAIED